MPWLWDVFISYPRGGDVERWVQEHLEPRLRGRLTDGWTRSARPAVFLDQRALGVGDGLDDVLRLALRSARVLIPVLTPSYRTRACCRAELQAFLARERLLGHKVVCPVLANGEDRDPPLPGLEGRVVEDFRKLVYVGACYEGSEKYMPFQDGVQRVVTEVLRAIERCPTEPDPTWPVADLPSTESVIPTYPMPWLNRR